jgi:hypothetical protein
MLLVGHGHHITSTYPRMTLPRDHEKSKRSWKRFSKRAKRPKRLPNFHRQHKFDERDVPVIIEIVDSTSYPSIRDKAARLGCAHSTARRFVNARKSLTLAKGRSRAKAQGLRHSRYVTAALLEDIPDTDLFSHLSHLLHTTLFACAPDLSDMCTGGILTRSLTNINLYVLRRTEYTARSVSIRCTNASHSSG